MDILLYCILFITIKYEISILLHHRTTNGNILICPVRCRTNAISPHIVGTLRLTRANSQMPRF